VILVSLRIGDREHDKAQVLLDIRNIPSTNDLQIVYLRALLALRKGDLPKARDEVNQILQRAPGHAPTLTLAGEIEFRANSLALAEDLFRKALRSAPDASATKLPQRLPSATTGQAVDALQFQEASQRH
jgi:predicted Zn-dependent protease